MRTLRKHRHEVVGLDLVESPFTTHVGSVSDRDLVRGCLHGVDVVIHAATLHKPHVATHSRHAFVETNVAGIPGIDRVYVNHRAQKELGWRPRFGFRGLLDGLRRGDEVFSSLARAVGSKGYHTQVFEDGPYPVES